jgi:Lon protease-like protein
MLPPGAAGGHSDSSEEKVLVPDVIPVFPLAGTVLLPKEVLPLHVFEPRYREMTRDALAGNRLIGMVEPAPGFEHDTSGEPPLRELGCLAVIAEHQLLEDGRYLMWLVGLVRFKVEREIQSNKGYRLVKVTYLPDNDRPEELVGMVPVKRELNSALPRLIKTDEATRRSITEQLEEMSEQQLVAFASQVLGLPPERKRELQVADTVTARLLMVSEDLFISMENQGALTSFDLGELN